MLNTHESSHVRAVLVPKHEIEVVLSEEGISPLSFVMPPLDDLREISSLKATHFSIKEFSTSAEEDFRTTLLQELQHQLRKFDSFRHSTTYLTRLANLEELIGSLDKEADYLESALAIRASHFLRHRQIDNNLARGKEDRARAALSTADLATDIYANLRLAGLSAVNKDIDSAAHYVSNALLIDPLDFRARLFHGALELWKGDYSSAIHSFKVASESRFNSSALHTNLAIAYARIGRHDKALGSLKVAVSIDPLNANAVGILADISHSLHRDEEAIPSLRYLIRFEQKNDQTWGRLARALMEIKEYGEVIAALKRQASLSNHSHTWNNLGVAYHLKNDDKRALEAFKYAMSIAPNQSSDEYCFPAKNAITLIGKSSSPKQVLAAIDEVLTPENADLFAQNTDLSSIFMIRMRQLCKLKEFEVAAAEGETLLEWASAGNELKAKSVVGLLSIYSLSIPRPARALELAEEYSALAIKGNFDDDDLRPQLLNNIAFIFAENGQLNRAEEHLSRISSEIHRQPYPTATSGLLHLKRGHIDRATELYEEALHLAVSNEDKSRIRQKWNLELGELLADEQPRKARRHLEKARSEKEGEAELARRADEVLRRLPV